MLHSHEMSDEQLRGVEAVARWWKSGQRDGFSKQVFKLGGPAGSGKSTIAHFAIEACGLSATSDKVVTATPTGKAAYVLRQKGIATARTIHSAIYTPNDEVGELIDKERAAILELRGSLGGLSGAEREAVLTDIALRETQLKQIMERSRDEVTWVKNPFGPMEHAQLVVCDEASMVGGQLFKDLASFNVPLLMCGDPFQMPPIDDSGESVFFDKRGNALTLDYELKHIHRQAQGSPILRVSQAIRFNEPDMNFTGKQTGEDGGILLRVPYERLTDEMIARSEITLVGFNETRLRVNNITRQVHGRKSLYPEEGERIICLKNDKNTKRVNGEMGTVLKGPSDFNRQAGTCCLSVQWDDGTEQIVDVLTCYYDAPGDDKALYDVPRWSRMKNLHTTFAYCCTVSKFQGSQSESGMGFEENFGRSSLMQRRFRYTQLTRFSRNAVLAF